MIMHIQNFKIFKLQKNYFQKYKIKKKLSGFEEVKVIYSSKSEK